MIDLYFDLNLTGTRETSDFVVLVVVLSRINLLIDMWQSNSSKHQMILLTIRSVSAKNYLLLRVIAIVGSVGRKKRYVQNVSARGERHEK